MNGGTLLRWLSKGSGSWPAGEAVCGEESLGRWRRWVVLLTLCGHCAGLRAHGVGEAGSSAPGSGGRLSQVTQPPSRTVRDAQPPWTSFTTWPRCWLPLHWLPFPHSALGGVVRGRCFPLLPSLNSWSVGSFHAGCCYGGTKEVAF